MNSEKEHSMRDYWAEYSEVFKDRYSVKTSKEKAHQKIDMKGYKCLDNGEP